MQLAVPVGAKGNANVVSDAATANYLALSAFKSAMVNVNVNLTFIKDESFVAEWAGKRDLLQRTAMEAYEQARAACEATIKVTL
jgi:formiminotetrahydrofolate cyclodeaminase